MSDPKRGRALDWRKIREHVREWPEPPGSTDANIAASMLNNAMRDLVGIVAGTRTWPTWFELWNRNVPFGPGYCHFR